MLSLFLENRQEDEKEGECGRRVRLAVITSSLLLLPERAAAKERGPFAAALNHRHEASGSRQSAAASAGFTAVLAIVLLGSEKAPSAIQCTGVSDAPAPLLRSTRVRGLVCQD